jgi:tetrahydromethanopterin S-methyltransferase subunit F
VTDDAVILESQLQTTVANGFAVGFLIATMSVTAPLPSYAQRLN